MRSKGSVAIAILLCWQSLSAEVVELSDKETLAALKSDEAEIGANETLIEHIILEYAAQIMEKTRYDNRNRVQQLYAEKGLDFTDSNTFQSAGIAVYVPQEKNCRIYIAAKRYNTEDQKKSTKNRLDDKNVKTLMKEVVNSSHTERQLMKKIISDNKSNVSKADPLEGDLYIYTKENPCLYRSGENSHTTCCDLYKKLAGDNPHLQIHIYYSVVNIPDNMTIMTTRNCKTPYEKIAYKQTHKDVGGDRISNLTIQCVSLKKGS